ncbi:hypothetical protein EVAR_6607_1 [Eumeta japonica]|uniref:Uncharacterized protein n=1 Tax=Eumeta variegata TaxID=151549 RepID=A0A4C1TLM2_EUMVA|nr:hypothetical protein EVAR_6607_1 [Eumeta japonica]
MGGNQLIGFAHCANCYGEGGAARQPRAGSRALTRPRSRPRSPRPPRRAPAARAACTAAAAPAEANAVITCTKKVTGDRFSESKSIDTYSSRASRQHAVGVPEVALRDTSVPPA